MSGTLVSPGVSVTITDESFYGSAGRGTTPLIFVATAANKAAPSGSGIAPLTVPGTANTLFLATSQRELLTNFGNPNFTTANGTVVNGDELNEYGLHAAYSYLGISNSAYVLRAPIDLSQLAPSETPPTGPAINGTYWLDLTNTRFGLFQSNGAALPGSAWVSQTVQVVPYASVDQEGFAPLPAYGSNGSFCVSPWTTNNFFYEKSGGAWFQIGTPAWCALRPTTLLGSANPGAVPAGEAIIINGLTITFTDNTGALPSVVNAINAAFPNTGSPTVSASVSNNALLLKNNAGTGLTLNNVGQGTVLSILGFASPGAASVTAAGVSVARNSNAAYPTNLTAGSLWVKGNPANNGAAWIVRYYTTAAGWTVVNAPFVPFNSTLADGSATKDAGAASVLGTPVAGTLYIGYDSNTGIQQIRRYSGSGWGTVAEVNPNALSGFQPLEYEADFVAPTTAPAAGTYWYDAVPQVDIMVGDGQMWHGYANTYPGTDSTGVILSGSAPVQQVGGHTVLDSSNNASTSYTLVENDLWLDTANTENYPTIYRWDSVGFQWNLIDNTDQTTPFGIIFADARQDSGTTFTGIANAGAYAFSSTALRDLVLSDFVEPDAPLADAHPAGMLLFNMRYSTGNVKVWNPTYFLAGGFDPHTNFTVTSYPSGNPNVTFPPLASAGRWVNASGNNATTGAPYMLRMAQRQMVVKSLASVIASNQDIRSELVFYNLIAAPGYVELLSEMEALNVDQMEVAFVVGDTPARLASDSTSLQNWATNAANVATDGDGGLVTDYEFSAVYYPWGLGQDLSGNSVMVPPSTVALRTIAYSDQVSYPWFAPAGFTRGLVSNATSVGYLTSTGTFQPVILNQGQRDTLYSNSVNPIAYIPGRGLVVYGQKTLQGSADASLLSRINVARLVNYIKYNLDIIVKPYLFEQNDSVTQTAALNTVSRFLNSLVGLRALSDYAVVCDSTNNTPDRIDLNELWIDVLIQPLSAVEFIYIPVRIENAASATNINISAANAAS